MFEDTSDELREDDYCDKCDLCVRNSLIPSRGQGLEGSGTILHLVAAPSPADRKTKYVLSGNTGKFIRRILEDKKLLALSYITSVVKCGTSQTINAKAITECFPRLQREIARVEPSMFITYGKDPYFIVIFMISSINNKSFSTYSFKNKTFIFFILSYISSNV